MIKTAIDLHKNKTQRIEIVNNKLYVFNCKLYDNRNISNYAKYTHSDHSFGLSCSSKSIKTIIISNSVIKYENKCNKYIIQQILPNSIIYYINNSFKINKTKIKINKTQNNKHIIHSCQRITQKYHMNTIFLQIVQINMLKNTMQNFLINETKKLIVNLCNNTQIKKLYFYDGSKLTIDVPTNNLLTNICVSRGMHYIIITCCCLTTKETIFYDVTKILKKYFIYKIHLYSCNMIDSRVRDKISNLNCDVFDNCKRNYNFLRNTYEFKIYDCVLNLTNIKKYYYLLFVKKITIECDIIYNVDNSQITYYGIGTSWHYCLKIKKLFFNKKCSSSLKMHNYENKYCRFAFSMIDE